MHLSNRSSSLINVLKCFCCIGVVLLHSLFKNINVGSSNLILYNGYGWDTFVDISTIIYRTMVPMFFLLSGYLMFLNYGDDSFNWYLRKFKNRIHTLLIPYIMGIILVYLCFILGEYLLAGIMANDSSHKYNILTMFWYPLPNAVYWFLRDLMVVTLLSPLVVKIMDFFKWHIVILIIFLLWFTDLWSFQLPGLSSISFLFFYLGVFFSIKRFDFVKKIAHLHCKWLVLIIYIILVVSANLFESEYLTKLSIFFGISSLILMTDYLFPTGRLKKFKAYFWIPATFFIYSYHVVVEVVVKKTLFVLFCPNSSIMYYLIYIVTVFTTIAILSILYYLINKYVPFLSRLLTGR